MADFTVEGIIEVDVSRGIRDLDKFKAKLQTLQNDIKETGREIDKLSRKKVDIEVTADSSEIEKLRKELESLDEHEKVKIDIDADTTKAFIKVSEFVKMIDGLRATIDIDADTDQAMIAALKLREEINRMRATIKVDADEGRLGGGGGGSGGGILGGLGSSALIGAIVALVATLGPLTAALAALGAAGIGGISILTAGFGSLAAFAIPTIKDITEGIKLLTTDVSKLSPEKLEEFNEKLAEFKKTNPGVWALSKGFLALKDNYMEFANSIKPDIIRATGHAIGFLNNLVKQTGPIAQAAAPAFADLIKSMKVGVAGKEWTDFFNYVKSEIPGFISGFGQFLGNILTGVANLAVALDPVTDMIGNGFLKMSEDFREWSQTLATNKGFQSFVDYMVKMGPQVWDTIKSLSVAIGDMLIALAPLGERVLNAIKSFSEWYSRMAEAHPEMTEFATQAVAIGIALAPLLGNVTALLGPIGSLAGAVGGTAVAIGAVVALFAGLGTYLALTTDTGENFTSMWKKLREAWDKAKETGKELWNNLKEIWTWVEKSGAIEQYQQAIGHLADAFQNFLPLIKTVAIIIGAVLVGAFIALGYAVNILSQGIQAFSWIVEKVVNAVVGFFKWLYDVLVGHSIIPDLVNGIIMWFAKLPGRLAGIVGKAVGWIVDKFVQLKNMVVDRVQNLVSSAVNLFGNLKSRIFEIVTGIPGWLGSKFSAAKTAVITKIVELKTSAVEKFQSIITRAREIFSTIKNAIVGGFKGAGSWLLDAGKKIIGGLLDGLNSKLDDLKGLADKVGGVIGKVLPGSPVEEGPLTKLNNGYAGGEIIRMVIGGIDSERSALRTMMTFVAKDVREGFGDASTSLNGNLYSAMGTPAGGGGGANGSTTIYNEFNVPPNFDKREFGRLVDESLYSYYSTGGQKNV